MTLEEATKRIEELERKVKELEARPAQAVHYHTHQAPYIPAPIPYPPYWTPIWNPTFTTIGAAAGGNISNQVLS